MGNATDQILNFKIDFPSFLMGKKIGFQCYNQWEWNPVIEIKSLVRELLSNF